MISSDNIFSTIEEPVVGGEQRRVIPTHSTDHSQVESDGTPKKLKAGDTKCDQDGEFLGPIIHRDPPKDQVHPEKKESGKKELSGI